MKVFLSHSSRNKPLVRELRSLLPEHVNTWIDEKELLAGDALEETIRNAIESDCDFLVVFLDDRVVTSDWIRRELQWARDEEKRLGRPFILPVLIDDVDLEGLDWLRQRLFLRCHGFSETDIRQLAGELSSTLFAWLSRDLERLRRPMAPDNELAVLERADQLLRSTAQQVRAVVLPYRKSNPLPLSALYEKLIAGGGVPMVSPDDLHELLFRLRERKLLSGIVVASGKIYVEEEHLNWRLQESATEKQAIADFLTDWIDTGNVVFVDGGSTALRICKNIARNVRFRNWESLTVVTNSPPVAAEFASLANELGLDDHDQRLQLYMIGGRMRMNAATIVRMPGGGSAIPDIAEQLGGFDIAFCGTNGIHWPSGCTTTAESQAEGKNRALLSARRRVIMADSSKYGVRQEQVFADFGMNLEIVTALGGNRAVVEDFTNRIAETSSKIVLVD